MALTGRNPVVELVFASTSYGFAYEGVGDLREVGGEWRLSAVPIDDTLTAILKGYNGAVAIRILIAPILHDFVAADNTLGQVATPYTPGSSTR